MNDFIISKTKSQYRKHKKQLLMFNTIVSIVLAVSIIFAGTLGAVAYITSDMRMVHLSNDHDDLGIDTSVTDKLPKEIVNVALFGIDSRSNKTTNLTKALSGRSDTIIILSINTIDKTIKMTSILRDSWVPILNKKGTGVTYNKINAAYSVGGAQRAIHTINSNFGLNITDYVSVNMHQMEKIIDVLDGDGLEINITPMEMRRINELSDNNEGFNSKPLTHSGLVKLNATQALCYSRIRNDSEEIRVMRQQKVLGLLLENAKQIPTTQYPEVLKTLLSVMETSMSYDDILKFSPMLSVSSLHLETTAIPGKEVVAQGGAFGDTGGRWVWKYDLEEAKKHIYSWIYGI